MPQHFRAMTHDPVSDIPPVAELRVFGGRPVNRHIYVMSTSGEVGVLVRQLTAVHR
jgi:hypothetical protein